MADGDNYTSAMYYSDAQICIRQILNARIGIDEDQFNHYYSFAKDEARQLLGSHGDADAVEYMTLAWTWMYFLGRPCSGGFPIHNPALPPAPELPKILSRSTSASSITTEKRTESIECISEKSAEPLTPTTPFSDSTNDSQHMKIIESPVKNQKFKLVTPPRKNNKIEFASSISTTKMSSKNLNSTNRFSVLDASDDMLDNDASDEGYGGKGKATTVAEGKAKRKRAKKAKKDKKTVVIAVEPESQGEKMASGAETSTNEIKSKEGEKAEEAEKLVGLSNEILENYNSFDSKSIESIIQYVTYSKKIGFFLGFGAGIVFGGTLVSALNL